MYLNHETIAVKLSRKCWNFGEDFGIKYYTLNEPFNLHECIRVEYHTVILSVGICQCVSGAIELQGKKGVQVRKQQKLIKLRALMHMLENETLKISKKRMELKEDIGREEAEQAEAEAETEYAVTAPPATLT